MPFDGRSRRRRLHGCRAPLAVAAAALSLALVPSAAAAAERALLQAPAPAPASEAEGDSSAPAPEFEGQSGPDEGAPAPGPAPSPDGARSRRSSVCVINLRAGRQPPEEQMVAAQYAAMEAGATDTVVMRQFGIVLAHHRDDSEVGSRGGLIDASSGGGVFGNPFNTIVKQRLEESGVDAVSVFEDVVVPLAATHSTQCPQTHDTSCLPEVPHNQGCLSSVPWHLDRIDQSHPPLDDSFRWPGGEQCLADGAGVDVYVLDTGIRNTHVEFTGRASSGLFNAVSPGSAPVDRDGHGTCVAGAAAGATLGVAKEARVHAVKVLEDDGYGSFADLLQGMQWVVLHDNGGAPKVVVLSVGRPVPAPTANEQAGLEAVEDAIRSMVGLGVVVTIAAGNYEGSDSGPGAASLRDSCMFSPARIGAEINGAITVAGSSGFGRPGAPGADIQPPWTRAGACADLFAPGDFVLGASQASDQSLQVCTGTSMAAPMVAGAAALLLSGSHQLSPATAEFFIKGTAAAFAPDASLVAGSPPRLLSIEAWLGEHAAAAPPPADPTCVGHCGQQGGAGDACWCDANCLQFGDCCDDACLECSAVFAAASPALRASAWCAAPAPECFERWTQWYNRDRPAGTGDHETVDAQFGSPAQWTARPGVPLVDRPCYGALEHGYPVGSRLELLGIQCQTSPDADPPQADWQDPRVPRPYVCSMDVGGRCRNEWVESGLCLDFRVRYLCRVCPAAA